MMALFDFALVNADIHYHMDNPEKKGKGFADHHHAFFESVANGFMDTDWTEYKRQQRSQELDISDNMEQAALERKALELVGVLPESNSVVGKVSTMGEHVKSNCDPMDWSHIRNQLTNRSSRVSHGAKACQICLFEGCGMRTKFVQYCSLHQIRACTSTAGIEMGEIDFVKNRNYRYNKCNDWSWRCPDDSLTCWEKAHAFYIPQGLFTSPKRVFEGGMNAVPCVNLRPTNLLYQKKMASLSVEEYVFDKKHEKYVTCESDCDVKIGVAAQNDEVEYEVGCNDDDDINVTELKDSAEWGLDVAVTESDLKDSADVGLGVAAGSVLV